MKKVVSSPTEKKVSPIELIVSTLKDYNVNGEELETLINDLGMEEQMLRQLALKADVDTLKQLIEEKEQLEVNQTEVFCVNSFTTLQADLIYKGIEYRVKTNHYDDGDRDYIVTYLHTSEEISYSDDIFDEIITYIEENVMNFEERDRKCMFTS